VLEECGASCLKDVCDLLEDEHGRANMILSTEGLGHPHS
jgi:hypothetical protein